MDVSLRLILKEVNNTVYYFFGSNLGIEIFLKKGTSSEKGCVEIEHSIYTLHLCFS